MFLLKYKSQREVSNKIYQNLHYSIPLSTYVTTKKSWNFLGLKTQRNCPFFILKVLISKMFSLENSSLMNL